MYVSSRGQSRAWFHPRRPSVTIRCSDRRRPPLSNVRFQISMSLDGFTAGPEQSTENPLGIGGFGLHEWVFPLAAWRASHGLEGGEINESTAVIEETVANVGATIMGRNMFGG